MAEKDIKKTPATTQTVQPSADKYTTRNLKNAAQKYLEFLANVQ